MKDLDKVIGANLRMLRQREFLQQEVVANYLGIHQTALSRVEQGKQKLTPEQLLKAAQFFELNVDWFFGGRG